MDCRPLAESSTTTGMMPLSRRCWNVLRRNHRMLAHHAENALVLPRRKTKNTEHQH